MNLSYSILSQKAREWIFAFYGFGQQAEIYLPLVEIIEGKYNLIVIDLPYQYEAGSIDKDQFKTFIETLIEKYQVEKIIAISFSIGSRFNLVMAECLPHRISKLILIAPDGIRIRLWHTLATKTRLGEQLFHYLVISKNVYINLINIFYKLRLLSKPMFAFAKWHMRNEEWRMKVYHVWMNMKKLIPDLDLINKHKATNNFEIIAYFGKEDTIIDQVCMKKLVSKIPSVHIVLLNKGHNLLDKELFYDIAQHL